MLRYIKKVLKIKVLFMNLTGTIRLNDDINLILYQFSSIIDYNALFVFFNDREVKQMFKKDSEKILDEIKKGNIKNDNKLYRFIKTAFLNLKDNNKELNKAVKKWFDSDNIKFNNMNNNDFGLKVVEI